jgi:hypothetical protein
MHQFQISLVDITLILIYKNHGKRFSNIMLRKYMNEAISVLLDAFGKSK